MADNDWFAQILSEQERDIIARAGYGRRRGMGDRPAILIVDVLYNFTGFEGKTLAESMVDFRNSCGPDAWAAVTAIEELIAAGRSAGLPIIYTGGNTYEWAPRLRGTKNLHQEPTESERRMGRQIVDRIAPRPGEVVIRKHKASSFFGTPLTSYLTSLGVDSLYVCGGSTSGCVRATVNDAFAYDYKVSLVRQGVFDRIRTSHLVNLFDMDAKYADVIELDDAVNAIAKQASAG